MSLKDYLTRLSNNLKTYLSYQNQQPKQKKKVELYVVCYIFF